MDNSSIRSFFAIPISFDCRQEIYKLILNLKSDFPSEIRWVGIDNLHLTLKFLGEFSSEDIPRIEGILKPVLFSLDQFDLTFHNLGVFPNERKPRIIWTGITYPDELTKIFQEIEIAALEMGYPKDDKGFSPHITIGRVKNGASDLLRMGDILKKKRVGEICRSHVDRVNFYQSSLRSTGPVYSILFHLPLNK
jgi:2'-5' RNA ligase